MSGWLTLIKLVSLFLNVCVSQMECNDLWSAHQTDSSYRKGGGSIRLSLTGNLVIMFHSIAVFTVIYSNKCSLGRTSFKNIINPKPLNSSASCLNHVFEIQITQYADSVATHLTKILESDKHSDVISSAKWVKRWFVCGCVVRVVYLI